VISEAYLQLHGLSWSMKIDALEHFSVIYRIAVYLNTVPNCLAWRIVKDTEGKTKKDKTLEWVPKLTDSEWDKIQRNMMDYIDRGNFSTKRRAKKIDWIRSLDLLREFERE